MFYARIIDLIYHFHFAITLYDYLCLETWKELMVLSCTMNKQNYAQYGSYYVTQMGTLDIIHSGAHAHKGFLVYIDNTGTWQSINELGNRLL